MNVLAELARELVGPAADELDAGYARLVRELRANRALGRIAHEHGAGAVLATEDPAIAALRKANRELVTDAERRAELLMREAVRARHPTHAIVGEELGTTAGDDWLWVFDPVDGTSAMVRTAIADAFGLSAGEPRPAFGITIGVLHADEAVIGVVAELRAEDGRLAVAHTWVGVRGQPTTRDGEPVAPAAAPALRDAVLASTVPEVMFATPSAWGAFSALRESTGGFVADQNCVGWMRLLDGGADVVCEADLTLPDAAALIAPLAGAGIAVTDLRGAAVRFDARAREGEYRLLAAAPSLHAQALDTIRHAGPREPGAAGVHAGYAQKFDTVGHLARPEILALKPYSSARTEGEQQAVSIYLDANENPYPPFPGDDAPARLNYYPEPQPSHLLKRFAEHFGTARERLLMTRGADEAIDLLVRAFCSARRDGIVICPPTFPMYALSAQIQDAAVHSVPLLADAGFQLDVEGIVAAQAANPALKLVFVCTPNNPTGNLLRREDVLRLCSHLRGRAIVVADHAYVEYSGQAPLTAAVDAHPNLVVLRTLSKEYSLAGERLGITIARPEVIGILGRILAPYPLPQSVIATVTAAMTPDGVAYARANIERLLAERARVERALATLPATRVAPSDANFLLVEVAQPRLLVRRMQEAGIKIRDRSAVPGIEGSVRIGIGAPEHNDAMLAVFRRHVETLGDQPETGAVAEPSM
jgi:histidinol-phosphate aminotransferase